MNVSANQVAAILRQGGIQARVDGETMRIAVNDRLTLTAGADRNGWFITIGSEDQRIGGHGLNAEQIAVAILRALLAAGRSNPVAHPHVQKTQSPVSGL